VRKRKREGEGKKGELKIALRRGRRLNGVDEEGQKGERTASQQLAIEKDEEKSLTDHHLKGSARRISRSRGRKGKEGIQIFKKRKRGEGEGGVDLGW